MKLFCTVALLCALCVVHANDNGLAITPPLGWRSWNLYGANVDQNLIQSIMKGMTAKKWKVDGVPTSLCDLGYCDVGLDDNWQSCKDPRAADGMNYHDSDGNPIINLNRFPDMKKMTDYAHSLGLSSGWYGNNCICSDHCRNATECENQIKGDVGQMAKFNFDSWKLDGCGGETDLVLWNKYINATGKAIMVENCHWGSVKPFKPDRSLPAAEGCPWNFYRSSGDVRASYASVLHNLGTVMPLRSDNLSYPGCWAYPDMLQVGCQHGPGGARDPGLSEEETRTHFGAWAIVSSPLTLSHDVNNDTVMEQIWDVISNKEVLAVNQAYFGDSGGVFQSSEAMLEFSDAHIKSGKADKVVAPQYQYLSKPIGNGEVAVLLMNSGDESATLTLNLADIPDCTCGAAGTCHVRDIWNHKDLGSFDKTYAVTVASHDAAFITLKA